MQLRQTPGEVLSLTESDALSFLKEQGVQSADAGKFVNYCNSIAANAPLQCVNCPDIGLMALDAFNGESDPEQTERGIQAIMSECNGAKLDIEALDSSSGYVCGSDDIFNE